MIDTKFFICTFCIKTRIRRFDNLRNLHTHITMKHGKKIKIRIDETGTIRLTRAKKAKLYRRTVLNQS